MGARGGRGSASTSGVITAQKGTFIITGNDAGLVATHLPLTAALGTFTITGIDATLTYAGSTPAAPVLSMDASWDSSQASPLFDIDAAFVDQDDLQFEIQTAGAGWASPTVVNHTVTTAEISGGQISLSIGALSNGDYEARCKFKHFGGVYSSYSNVQAFTIAAVISNYTAVRISHLQY